MIVRTDILCGNGRVRWLNRHSVEIEVLSYSKGPRYCTFSVTGVEHDGDREIVLRPDPYARHDFRQFCLPIWWRILPDGDWVTLSEDRVQIQPDVIRLRLPLRAGMDIQVSTEPPRPYPETVLELYELTQLHRGSTTLHWIGYSWEGRPIPVLRVTSDIESNGEPGAERRPVILCTSGEHATESAGEELTRGMLKAALEDSADGEYLRRTFVMDFLLNANPDGNIHGWHQYNKKDWMEHNYSEQTDRSWHHEFGPYFAGELENPSPETVAVADWVEKVSPVFHHNAHSWEGHNGNPGCFRFPPEKLPEPLREGIISLDRISQQVASEMGITFEIYPSSNIGGGHITDYLLLSKHCLSYTLEGHMALGREKLQEFGRRLFHAWLAPDGVLKDRLALTV